MEQSVFVGYAKFMLKFVLEFVQWSQNCIARVIDCSCAVFYIREQLAFVQIDKFAIRKKSAVLSIDAIFQAASVTSSVTASLMDSACSKGTQRSLKFGPFLQCSANTCSDSLLGSKLTWFALPHLWSSPWHCCISVCSSEFGIYTTRNL